MNKRNLFSILFRETAISYGIIVIIGIFARFLFFKLAELVLVNIMDRQVNYRVYDDWKGALAVHVAFAAIYLLILLNTLWQIHTNNPIALLHSDSEGERPIQSRNFLTVLGSVRVEIPVERIGEELSGKAYTAGYQSGIDAIVEAVWQKDDWSKQADTEADDNAQFCTVHFANMLAMLVDGQLDLGRDMRDTWFTPGVHLVFTSNIVAMMHSLLFSANRALMVRVMVATYVIFAVFYSLVYALSSKTYFNIVNRTINE